MNTKKAEKLAIAASTGWMLLASSPTANAQNVSIAATPTPPDPSAGLEVNFTDRGLLIPRVALTSTADVTTIANPANGLVVYNTNAAMTGGNGVGFYYYCSSGCATTGWKYMATPANGPGTSGQVLTSQGPGNSPTWSTLSVSGGGGPTGCASCITAIRTTIWSGVNWGTCATYCSNLVEGGFSDWRMPTFDEVIYYRTTFAPPNGSWINGWVWTSTPWDARVAGTPSVGIWVVFAESNGSWNNSTSTGSRDCRCVRYRSCSQKKGYEI